MMKPGISSVFIWLLGVACRLILVFVLAVILPLLFTSLRERLHFAAALSIWLLPVPLLVGGYTWAVYYRLPFFRNRSRPRRILIASGLAMFFIFLTVLLAGLALHILLEWKYDQRVETVTLPSGDILENHTYLKEGWGDERYNTLFLNDPATGVSEQIDDPSGYLNYEAGPSNSSLLQRYPHPQEFALGDEKVLIVGPFACKRFASQQWLDMKGPHWDLFRFEQAEWKAADYIREVWQSMDAAQISRLASRGYVADDGPQDYFKYQFDSLDLTNNVLTVKRARTDLNGPWGDLSDHDFPQYLVYSPCKYDGTPDYDFPWEFDLARTCEKNGPRWLKPMPFRIALDYSVVTYRGTPGAPDPEDHDLVMARPDAKEIATATLELSGRKLRATECRFTLGGTNHIVEKFKAMYVCADARTNHINIIWQPHVAGAFPGSGLNLGDWIIVGKLHQGTDCDCDEFIRLRRIDP